MAMWSVLWPALVSTGQCVWALCGLIGTIVCVVVMARWCWRVTRKTQADE